jgi:hypothetical protein
MEILRLCFYDYASRLWKMAKNQGDPKRSPIFMGNFGQKSVNLVENRKIWDLLE